METAWIEEEGRKNKEGIETICYRCGEKVHISRNCNRREKECKHCGREGHVETECEEKYLKCWRCQKLGHRESRCEEKKTYLGGGEREEKGESNIVRGKRGRR